MLSGNVTALFQDGDLIITGDEDNNSIEVVTSDEGVIVRGLDGTTVNDSADDAVIVPGETSLTGSLIATMGAGDDQIQVDGVDVQGEIHISGGDGEDEIAVTSLAARRAIVLNGNQGDDTIVISDADARRRVMVHLGQGNDIAAISGLTTRRKLVIAGSTGDDNVGVEDSTIRRLTRLRLGSGDDNAAITNSELGLRLKVRGGLGDDLVHIEDSTVNHVSRLFGKLGNDSFLVLGTSDLGRWLIARGGAGDDALEIDEDVAGSKHRILRNFESDEVDLDLIDERLDDPTTGLFALIQDALDGFSDDDDEDETLDITIASSVMQSSGVVITDNSTLEFNVVGRAGLMVEIDVDGDGQFDDGSATLDSMGMATVQITLVHNSTNLGLNTVRVRGVDNGVPLSGVPQEFDVHFAIGTVVRFTSDLGNIDVELLDTDAPITVANFLNYDARYDGSIVHRSAHQSNGGDFIIQGGAFDLLPPLTAITTDAAITNEFNNANSNVRGTLSMALPANSPNAGTSQWFFNVADNSFLDAALHTVFGRVVGDGMDVVDAIHALNSFNLIAPTGEGALGEVPLQNYMPFTNAITGTVNTTTGSLTVTGTGTMFTTELVQGATIQIDGINYVINLIADDTTLSLASTAQTTVADATAFINAEPDDADYVQFTTIDVLL